VTEQVNDGKVVYIREDLQCHQTLTEQDSFDARHVMRYVHQDSFAIEDSKLDIFLVVSREDQRDLVVGVCLGIA